MAQSRQSTGSETPRAGGAESGTSQEHERSGKRGQETGSRSQAGGDGAAKASTGGKDIMAQTQDQAGTMIEQARQQATTQLSTQQQAQGFWQMLQANPIAAGALGLGIGAIAGMAFPETEKEHRLMGETRDRVIGSVQEVAGESIGKARHIAEEAGRTALEEAKSQGMMPGGSSGSGASV